MLFNKDDTPPSSISGDEIIEVDDMIILNNMDVMEDMSDDYEEMEEVIDEEIELPEEKDLSIVVFNKHSGSVFCCNFHPSGKFAVTGGEDDKAYVWSVETGQVIMESTGHKDSIIFVGFSFDGAYMAAIDMSGIIKVWKCNFEDTQQEWPVVFEYEAGDVTWGLWHFGTKVLFCGAFTGDIFVFKIPSGDIKILPGHNIKTECGKLFQDGVRLVAGYEDGAVKIWDLKTNSVLQQLPHVHEIRVIDVDTHPDNNLIASITGEGETILATSANGKIVAQFKTENDLEALAFSNPELGYLALGTLYGSVTIWDVSRKMMRYRCSESGGGGGAGVTKMFWVEDKLVTGCLGGSIRVYDGKSGERCMILTGHLSEILDICYNEKEKLILSSSDDGTARIFKYP